MAMTADGKIATANRGVVSFGSARDREHLYELRATADAVICGARTIREASAILDVGPERYQRARRRLGLSEGLLRVVVSGSARLPGNARLLHQPESPLIVICCDRASAARRRRLTAAGATVRRFGRHRVDLPRALQWLAQDLRVRRLLCEGGAELNAGLLRAGLVDEVCLTICPWLAGGRTSPTIAEGNQRVDLPQALPGRLIRRRRLGPEQYLVYALSSARRAISHNKSDSRFKKTRTASLPN